MCITSWGEVLYVRCCSAMLLDLSVFQNGPDFKWVLASYVGSIWGPSARIEATMGILGFRLGRNLAILDHVKVCFFTKVGAKSGHVRSC